MASLDSLQVRSLTSKGVVLQVGTDTAVAIRLRYIGTGTVTSVTVTAATNLVTITSDGGTDTFTFATVLTVGGLVDAINAAGIFEAKVLDALRSQDIDATTLLDGAVTASTDENGVVVWDLKNDSSTALELGVCLSSRRNFDAPKGHRVHLTEIVYSVNMGTAAADSMQVYKRKGAVETKLFGALSVDTTETTLRFANGEGKITVGDDEEIFVRVKDAATLADAAGNFVRITGIIE